ncbi:galactokinase family protein [Corynebacterium sp. H127]|uniref:galactokinase family protein n=1 Tax=Corynebacterium sp. H127 TaxID=3133418 RepID=UPI0030B589D7
MPVWPSPDSTISARISELHQAAYDATAPEVATAPATWTLLGEHTDQFGGIVISAVADHQVAVAASPRDDDTVMVTLHGHDCTGEALSVTGGITLAEIAQYAASQQHIDGIDTPPPSQLPLGGIEVRLAGVVWSMVNRQYLSRDTKGFNITVLSEIPAGVGLGDDLAAEVAFAKILIQGSGHKLDPPLLARLAELCASSASTFSTSAAPRARYTTALRGAPSSYSIVDYADDSVTKAPLLRESAKDFGVFLVVPPIAPSTTANITERSAFLAAAAAAFGVDNLRRLPDAAQRVAQWLTAVHQASGPDGLPAVTEASGWLSFYESETARAAQATMALRARKVPEVLQLVNDSQAELSSLYHAVPEQEAALVKLCRTRGAAAARSSYAGVSSAVLVHAEQRKCENLIADLAEDGLLVIRLSSC